MFFYPPGRNGWIGCCFNVFKVEKQGAVQRLKVEMTRTVVKMSVAQAISKNIQSSDRLIINALGLFILRVTCPLFHFPKNLKYPSPLGLHMVLTQILQFSNSGGVHYHQAPRCVARSRWDKSEHSMNSNTDPTPQTHLPPPPETVLFSLCTLKCDCGGSEALNSLIYKASF